MRFLGRRKEQPGRERMAGEGRVPVKLMESGAVPGSAAWQHPEHKPLGVRSIGTGAAGAGSDRDWGCLVAW